MSIVVYQEVGTPIIPAGDLTGPVRDALGASLRSMRYPTSDFSGLYQDAAGATPVTAVGQPVGLILDRRFGLARGAELGINGDLSRGSEGWLYVEGQWALGGDGFSHDPTGQVSNHILYASLVGTFSDTGNSDLMFISGLNKHMLQTPDGKVLELVADVEVNEGGILRIRVNGSSLSLSARVSAPFRGTVTFVSLREVPGNHASQPTTTARPTLRSGPLRIDYDGADDFLRTTFPSALGSNVTIARSIPGEGAQILTGQIVGAEWDDNVTSCATLVIDRALTGPETALVTAFLNQQAGV